MQKNTPPSPRELGDRLKLFMLSAGLDRGQLAEKVGVSPATLYRWERGASKPSPMAAKRLQALGFGKVDREDTDHASQPRLKRRREPKAVLKQAIRLKSSGGITVKVDGTEVGLVPAPFVRNGPPDQSVFHRELFDLQLSSKIPFSELAPRLSAIESIESIESVETGRSTSQHSLERPKETAVSWNSNYGSHGWHRYVGRFPPHLVRALLNHFGATQASVVCDPFSGSGTTAVECRLLGIPFVGVEICPLSAMMTRVKAGFPLDASQLKKATEEFAAFYERTYSDFVDSNKCQDISHDLILDRSGNPIAKFVNIERWFTPEALLGTSIAVQFALKKKGYLREFLLTAISAKMRSIGNVDVDVVRAEFSKTPRENVRVGEIVFRQLAKMINGIDACRRTHAETISHDPSITILEESALDADIGAESIDCIITSPPYGVEAISYLRTHLLSYRALSEHLKHDPYDSSDRTIGSEYLSETNKNAGVRANYNSESFRRFFAAVDATGDTKYLQRRVAMMQFCDDMLAIGERFHRWLRPGGKVAFVIGNKRLGDKVIPMEMIIEELFDSAGLRLERAIKHKLKTNNSNSQVPWQERIIQEEFVMIFSKEE